MNEGQTERRLRGWLDAQASPAVPDDLRQAVATIPTTVPVGWRDRLAAALGWRPAAVSRPVWLLLAAALLIALVSTTAFIGARLLESRPLPPDPNALVPTAVPSTMPTPNPSPSPLVLDPSTAHWTKLGTSGGGGALVGFDGGYVQVGCDRGLVLGRRPDLGAPRASPPSSPTVRGGDRRAMRRSRTPRRARSATNGRELVIVGEEQPHDTAGCANVAASVRPVAWYSPDGRTWRRSAPFETGGLNSRATAVWAIPSGWQAAVQGAAAGTIAIWESSDGLAWHEVLQPVAVTDVNVYAGAAPDGTVVMSRSTETTFGLTLFLSYDGKTWAPIRTAGGCEATPGVTQILGPAADGLNAWVLVDDMRLCTSRDLKSWSATTMTAAPAAVAQTRYGAMVLADACFGAGSTCAPEPQAYVTTDGRAWTPIPHPPVYWGRSVADGPAGVLLVGQGTADSAATSVWRLDP